LSNSPNSNETRFKNLRIKIQNHNKIINIKLINHIKQKKIKVTAQNQSALFIVYPTCSTVGSFNFTVQEINSIYNRTVYSQPINVYAYNGNFVSYGTVADTFLTNLSVVNQCANNVPLGFNFAFYSTVFTTVSVCQQAYMSLGSSNNSANFIVATNTTDLALNSSWGTVSYRTINDSETLANLSSIIGFIFASSNANFYATAGFLATWNHVPYNSNTNAECNAQILLLTDGYFSFLVMNFGQIDMYTGSSFVNTSGLTTFNAMANPGTNVGFPGTYMFLVNGQSNK
jgi:hypothetical protein